MVAKYGKWLLAANSGLTVDSLFLSRLHNHEDDRGDADGDAEGHFRGKGFAEEEGADEDGRQGLEDAEDGGFCGADVAG